MRTYRAKSGPFSEQPFYKVEEVENICTDELCRVGLLPSTPSPVRVERFIEKKFRISPVYEELPEGVLGLIEFGPHGVRRIVVSKSLSEEGGKIAERRINTTLAHEAGHGLLHAHLFVLGEKPASLFSGDLYPNEPGILCRGEDIQGVAEQRKKKYEWWEYQANMAIGPLLLPRSLVITSLEPFLVKQGLLGLDTLDQNRREAAARRLAEIFEVNPIVAKIRLGLLFPQSAGQMAL
ncbi:MAG: hypothetical protein ACLPT6_03220 [Desulfobaccales bacterium]